MLDYDPAVNLRHHPGTPMSRYGLNPYLEPVFRIVFAPSRQTLVADGFGNARYLPEYGHLGDKWVMEKWLSGMEFCGKSRERYNLEEGLTNGPFPERGEYVLCHTFEACLPSEANLDKLVSWIKEGKNRGYQEIRTACRNQYEYDAKEASRFQDDVIRDAFSAFGNAAFVGGGRANHRLGGRNPKTQPILKSANELGLPLQGGKIRNKTRSVQSYG